jgi:hypothetical protein
MLSLARNAHGGGNVSGRTGLTITRWVLVILIGAWALNQLRSAFQVLVVMLGDPAAAEIDPTFIVIVNNMSAFAVALTLANAVCYTLTVALLVLRASLALPVYAAALFFDLVGWVIYSSDSIYDFWAASNHEVADWVANGLLLVCLIGVIVLRQSGALPKSFQKAR